MTRPSGQAAEGNRHGERFRKKTKALHPLTARLSPPTRFSIVVPGSNMEIPAIFKSWIYEEAKTEKSRKPLTPSSQLSFRIIWKGKKK